MGLGNNYKEAVVPELDDYEYKKKEYFCLAKKAYDKGVKYCFKEKVLKFPQEYFFLTLEQRNLFVRDNVLSESKKPRRIVILHTLKSPESHLYLDGLCFYANKCGFEIWDYRFGKYTLGNEIDLIRDRLNESCAVIFIASKEYIRDDFQSEIIKEEIKHVKQMRKKNDPAKTYYIDLSQNDEALELEQFCEKIDKDNIEKIFKNDEILDIYECRKKRYE